MESTSPESSPSIRTATKVYSAPRQKIYSVPRRYDLATLFAVSLAYALLFGLMKLFDADPTAFVIVAGFVTFAGLAQALLFEGKAPRAASAIAGATYWIVGLIIVGVLNGIDPLLNWVSLIYGTSCGVFAGSITGYFSGGFIGAVFMFADMTRRSARRFAGGSLIED